MKRDKRFIYDMKVPGTVLVFPIYECARCGGIHRHGCDLQRLPVRVAFHEGIEQHRSCELPAMGCSVKRGS